MEFSIAGRGAAGDQATTGQRVPRLTLVVPCYNEEAVLEATASRLMEILRSVESAGLIGEDSGMCFVDDGSTDRTWSMIQTLNSEHADICGLRLSRNFGHQNALLAGVLSVGGDVIVSLDADLQDDPSVIREMLVAHNDGADIVYAVRDDRSVDSWLKRTPAQIYYRLLRALRIDVVSNHADFRLMSRRTIECLREFGEVNLFLRGLVPELGFPSAVVMYRRQPRAAGETKYSLRRMFALAIDGITSFSAAPLRLIALLGILVFAGSVVVIVWALWVRLFTDTAVPGWASSVLPIYFLGGIQLLSIAIVGEYVAKIFLETKARPRFLLRETCGMEIEAPGRNRADSGGARR